MNIAQSATETTAVKPATTTIYINLAFAKLASDINSGALTHQFNGKGRKIAVLPETQEVNYLYYSSDAAGKDTIEPPFEINNGDNIKFCLTPAPEDNSKASYKWNGILQSHNDLQLVSGKKSTYNANLDSQATRSDEDDVTIITKFKVSGGKFTVAWDPAIKIKV
ncbi:hypothetical protein [Thalassotalea sp. PLHSN55]|uniref:hypothetical protein n=1 Tax=Thalassotalea sp. PLHSN55 TaxID=3435888 RepID=UPI003F82B3CA